MRPMQCLDTVAIRKRDLAADCKRAIRASICQPVQQMFFCVRERVPYPVHTWRVYHHAVM